MLRGGVGALACIALGVVVGVLGSFHQQSDVPVGALLGIVALLLAQVIVCDVGLLGLGPAIVLLAWTVVVAVLGTTTASGDLAVPANGAGSAFLYGGFVAGAALSATFAVRTATRRAADGSASGEHPPGR